MSLRQLEFYFDASLFVCLSFVSLCLFSRFVCLFVLFFCSIEENNFNMDGILFLITCSFVSAFVHVVERSFLRR